MKNIKTLATLALVTFLITGCSTKKYFEPEDTTDVEVSTSSLIADIKTINRDGATLDNGSFISELGESQFQLKEDFYFLNTTSNSDAISTNLKDKIYIGEKEYDLKNVAIAATKKDNLIAIINSDNSLELRDTNNNILFREYETLSLANDTRTTNPFFLGNLVLYPTLDGKIVIVSLETKKVIKKISVDPRGQFNNIIYLDVMEDGETLVAASANNIVAISPRNVVTREYEIRDVALDGNFIYAATLDGRVIKFSKNLEEQATQKFKFAKINALASSKSAIYAAESQGYIIKISKDFSNVAVDDLSYDESEKIIAIKNKFFTGDKVIVLP